jgi:2-succinyl-5-enolpyruvyl-6-hydroxy-3-cyclohexene-1-carboxylate synthase
MIEHLQSKKINRSSSKWVKEIKALDEKSLVAKNKVINHSKFPNECRIIEELINVMPSKSQLMISNSMPIRDFDYFAPTTPKNIAIFNNRGASGIDGITSTALGLAVLEKKPTVLLTGDSAFYYDLNSLLAAKKYKIPLIIILINNNGGGIFEVLPISKYGKVFNDFFVSPHNLDFSAFVNAFGGNYSLVKNWENFKFEFKKALTKKTFSVLEIKTDAFASLKLRQAYWEEANANLQG